MDSPFEGRERGMIFLLKELLIFEKLSTDNVNFENYDNTRPNQIFSQSPGCVKGVSLTSMLN